MTQKLESACERACGVNDDVGSLCVSHEQQKKPEWIIDNAENRSLVFSMNL